MSKEYNATLLDAELRAAGLDFGGCSSDGRIDWNGPPSQGHLDLAEQIKEAHDPAAKPARELIINSIKTKRKLGQSLSPAEILQAIDYLIGVI